MMFGSKRITKDREKINNPKKLPNIFFLDFLSAKMSKTKLKKKYTAAYFARKDRPKKTPKKK